jgi:hypothetical protein
MHAMLLMIRLMGTEHFTANPAAHERPTHTHERAILQDCFGRIVFSVADLLFVCALESP